LQRGKDLVQAMGMDLATETSGTVTKLLGRGVEHRDTPATERAMESLDQICGAGRFRAFKRF